MTDKVWAGSNRNPDRERDTMRSAIELCRLGESFDAYREIGKKISDEHDEPHPHYADISKWEEDLVGVAEGIIGDIIAICAWDAP